MNRERDIAARDTLWKAIIIAIDKLQGRCSVYSSCVPNESERINRNTILPVIENWRLLEALSLLSIPLRANEVKTPDVCNLFGKTGPIHIVEDGEDRFVWTQPTLFGQESDLSGRPDIAITSNIESPRSQNILRIGEAKC
jgi:hypothetical protein